MKHLITILVFLALLSCQGVVSVNPEDGLVGSWSTQFEQSYHQDITTEGASGEYTIVHTSRLTFDGETYRFEITPPVLHQFGPGHYDSVFEGAYVAGDTLLTLTDINHARVIEPYSFRIYGDTLKLRQILQTASDTGQVIEVPMFGGVAWGRAFMRHAGQFSRTSSLN